MTRDRTRVPGVVVSWVHHGRSTDLARILDFPELEPRANARRRSAPLRYLELAARTGRAIGRDRPQVVIVMTPPFVAGVVALVATRLFGGAVVIDAHSGTFNDPRWEWSHCAVRWMVRRARLTMVTNSAMAATVTEIGGEPFLLDDPVEPTANDHDWTPGTVLMPCTYADDEPVEAVLAAARSLPHVRVRLTGRVPDRYASLLNDHPHNLEFLGWLSADDYSQAMLDANVVLALTTREGTMQRGGYEALTVGRPLVTSDTDVLRSYFGDAAVYARPTGTAIAEAIEEAVARSEEIRTKMEALAIERWQDTLRRTHDLRAAVGVPS